MLNLDTHMVVALLRGDLGSREQALVLAEPWAISDIGIVTLIVLGRKGPHGFPFRRPHSHFPIH